MKGFLSAAALLFMIGAAAFGQLNATTDDGRHVLLNDDGTWEFRTEAESVAVDSDWLVRTSVDPLTDEQRTTLIVESDESDRWDSVMLVIRKTGSVTEAYINWDDYLGSDASTVTYRVAGEQMQRAQLGHSTNNTSTFFGPHTERLIASLLDNQTFVARVTPYNANPVTATFNVSGLREIVDANPHISDWADWVSESPRDVDDPDRRKR